MIQTLKSKTFSDYIGIISSSLCLVHCLFLPILMTILRFKHEENFWINLIFLCLSAWAILFTHPHNTHHRLRSRLWIAWIVLAVAILGEPWHVFFVYLSYVAAISLIALHIINIRDCHKCAKMVNEESL